MGTACSAHVCMTDAAEAQHSTAQINWRQQTPCASPTPSAQDRGGSGACARADRTGPGRAAATRRERGLGGNSSCSHCPQERETRRTSRKQEAHHHQAQHAMVRLLGAGRSANNNPHARTPASPCHRQRHLPPGTCSADSSESASGASSEPPSSESGFMPSRSPRPTAVGGWVRGGEVARSVGSWQRPRRGDTAAAGR